MTVTHLSCACGSVRIDVRGRHITSVECCCTTCRDAGDIFAARDGAPEFRTGLGTTPYVLYRKDRIAFTRGMDELRNHRLTPEDGTRRVVAACCNTPVFLEFKGGHWLSLFGVLWPDGERPNLELRTMARSMDDRSVLPDDVRNADRQTLRFFAQLMRAWIAMGFRVPRIDVPLELEPEAVALD